MDETTRSALSAWESFYVIVGSSAGALTGLQFVVLTLISESGVLRGSGEAVSAFGSPNVVHFCAALLVSALFSAPWHGLGGPGTAVALCGAFGLVYSIAVMRRARRQRDYQPVFEDWIWHAALPMLAYGAQIVAGIALAGALVGALYLVGASALLLVFIGIHNAWDTVMYVMAGPGREPKSGAAAPAAPGSMPTPATIPTLPPTAGSGGGAPPVAEPPGTASGPPGTSPGHPPG